MNLTKLAKICNVSVSTASKALSGSYDVSETTRELVIAAAKEHGCYQKYYKPKYNKKLIAVICPELLGIHYGHMATYIENEITSRGGTMLLSVHNFSHALQTNLIEYYTSFGNIDGIIIIDSAGRIKGDTSVPIVNIGIENESKNIDSVSIDTSVAMNAAISYAIKSGNKKIGFVGEKFADAEYGYFKKAIDRYDIEIDPSHIVISDKRFYDAGYYGMETLLGGDLPDIIFAAYNYIAVGIMQRLQESGLSVPNDISLVCMDDIISTPYPNLHLANIKMPMNELCNIALDLLFKKMDNSYSSLKQNITVIREFDSGMSVKTRKSMS